MTLAENEEPLGVTAITMRLVMLPLRGRETKERPPVTGLMSTSSDYREGEREGEERK